MLSSKVAPDDVVLVELAPDDVVVFAPHDVVAARSITMWLFAPDDVVAPRGQCVSPQTMFSPQTMLFAPDDVVVVAPHDVVVGALAPDDVVGPGLEVDEDALAPDDVVAPDDVLRPARTSPPIVVKLHDAHREPRLADRRCACRWRGRERHGAGGVDFARALLNGRTSDAVVVVQRESPCTAGSP